MAVALMGHQATTIIPVGFVMWMLGMVTLFATDGFQEDAPWWSIPAAIGALILLGLPPGLGFVSQSILLSGIVNADRLWWGAAFFFGTLFLVASLVRWLLTPAISSLPDQHWRSALYGVGLSIPVLLLLISGVYVPLLVSGIPPLALGSRFSSPGLVGWLLWLASLSIGGVLAWQGENVRYRIGFLLDAVYDFLRLEWLYDALIGAMDRGLGAIRAADEVVGGAGALLWSLLLFLVIIMIWSSR
jgi:formate hydrogenlyase subunit 3/multisubunit Na+/H+ antiporter MnhD subunit